MSSKVKVNSRDPLTMYNTYGAIGVISIYDSRLKKDVDLRIQVPKSKELRKYDELQAIDEDQMLYICKEAIVKGEKRLTIDQAGKAVEKKRYTAYSRQSKAPKKKKKARVEEKKEEKKKDKDVIDLTEEKFEKKGYFNEIVSRRPVGPLPQKYKDWKHEDFLLFMCRANLDKFFPYLNNFTDKGAHFDGHDIPYLLDNPDQWAEILKVPIAVIKNLRDRLLNPTDGLALKSSSTCLVCQVAAPEFFFEACGHQCLCPSCKPNYIKLMGLSCPACRTVSKSVKRLFIL